MTPKKIKFLSVARVLAIHDLMVKRFGGSFGVRDLGLIESAVARPQSGFGGEYLYKQSLRAEALKNIYDMAAALLQSLLKNHPFVDGNKRTALTSTAIFLKLNNIDLKNYHEEEVVFAVSVDNNHLSLEEISSWLKEHTEKGRISFVTDPYLATPSLY